MKQLIAVLLSALLLCGCAFSPAAPETTLPETTLPETTVTETTLPETTAPETTAAPDPLDLLLAEMTLEQKVGQLFIVAPEQLWGADGAVTAMSDGLAQALAQYPVGGIILFAGNIRNPSQLLLLTGALAEAPGIPMFIAVDEEGGIVTRLAGNSAFDLPRYQNAAGVASSGNPEDALDMGRTIGEYLKQYGFNLDFAPVADVNTNPRNPVIGTRAFSSDPRIAAQMAAAFTAGLNDQGIIATFKHFPGHGDTAEDSHSGLAVNRKTCEELERCEWLPFREAGSADFIMVGHIAAPEVTGEMTPATLSHEIVTDILKADLGFSGLIVTDSMQMGAITEAYSSGEAALGAFLAGCDIILMPENLPEAFEAVLTAVEDGRLSREWLDYTVRRILEFKQLHGILAICQKQSEFFRRYSS